MLRGGAICVGTDADLPALVALLAERSLPELFVVDDEGRLLGLVREVNVSRAIQFESTVSLPELPKERESGVYALMSTATAALESDSVRRALLQMAGAHLREIPVVTRDGQLLGVLRDVDGLRWIAAEQRAKR